MNKDEKLYLENVFIPNIEKIGYKLFQKNEELYKFCYKEQVFFNLFLHTDYLQGICVLNMKDKYCCSIHNLYLLDVNSIYLERLKEADECFYFDNKVQFIGILNCFYDLLKRNTENLINTGYEKLRERIIQENASHQIQKINIPQKEYLLREIERKTKWQESIRFTEI